jgi:hypothetical protein
LVLSKQLGLWKNKKQVVLLIRLRETPSVDLANKECKDTALMLQ